MVDFCKWHNFVIRMSLPELFGSIKESKLLKAEDFVRYNLNYPSYLDLLLGSHVQIKLLNDEGH